MYILINIQKKIFDLTDPRIFETYCKNAKSVGALFSFISCDVFKTRKWRDIKSTPEAIKSGYIHVYMLLSMIKYGCILKYCPEHLVMCRPDRGPEVKSTNIEVIHRVLLDINGYQMMADTLLPLSEKHYFGVLHVLHQERHGFSNLKNLRWRTNSEEWNIISEKFKKAGYSPLLIAFMSKAKPLISFLKIASAAIKKHIYNK